MNNEYTEIKPIESSGKDSIGMKLTIGCSSENFIGMQINQSAKENFFVATCPCGTTVRYPFNGLPEEDTRFPCENENHWVIKFTE